MSSPVLMADGTTLVPSGCGGCPLQQDGQGYMKPAGYPYSGVVLVGEALGADEAASGLPFVGAAGFALTRLFKFGGWRRDHVGIANVVWCRPPHNDLGPYQAARGHCTPNHLMPYLADCKSAMPQQSAWSMVHKIDPKTNHVKVVHMPVTYQPKQLVVVALGETAFNHLTGWSGIGDHHGYLFWSEVYGVWVIPVYHPAYLLRGNLNQMLWAKWEIERALHLAQQEPGSIKLQAPGFLVDPPLNVVNDFIGRYKTALKANPNLDLSFDIENPQQVMVRIGFTFGKDPLETMSLSWSSHYLPAIIDLLGGFGGKIAWNKSHDLDAVAKEQVTVRGYTHDAMNAWHCLHSDLDKALVNVTPRYNPLVRPWKHLFKTDMGFYNAMDSYVTWTNFQGITKELADEGMLTTYLTQIVQPDHVTDRMSAAGLQLDLARRDQLQVSLQAQEDQLLASMQQAVPAELLKVDPPQGYVKTPKDTTGMVQIQVDAEVWVCGLCGEIAPLATHFKGTKKVQKPCEGAGKVKIQATVQRWAKRVPFVPSTQQLLKYAAHQKHTVYKSWVSGNPTMDDEAIGRMLKKYPTDPLYPTVLDYRTVQKQRATYVEVPHDPDGTLHYRFNHKPSTGRLGCEGPNMQNWPLFARQLVIARPGHVFWKRDYSAIEAVLVGYEAKDPTYIRMAKLGIHDYVLGHYLKMMNSIVNAPEAWWPDAELRATFKVLKADFPAAREMCKRIVHLSNYLGTPSMIYSQYPKAFGSLANCAKLQDFYFSLFPKIREWHLQECSVVEASKYQRNAFGWRHFFFAAFDYERMPDGSYMRIWGPDAKRLIANTPQGGASGIMKKAMVRLGENDLVGPTLRLTVHDELFGECLIHDLDSIQHQARLVMEAPLAEYPMPPEWGLGPCLSIGTEGKAGFRWSEMHSWTAQDALLHQMAASL